MAKTLDEEKALHQATKGSDKKAIELVLKNRADVDLKVLRGSNHWELPVHLAATRHDFELAKVSQTAVQKFWISILLGLSLSTKRFASQNVLLWRGTSRRL